MAEQSFTWFLTYLNKSAEDIEEVIDIQLKNFLESFFSVYIFHAYKWDKCVKNIGQLLVRN